MGVAFIMTWGFGHAYAGIKLNVRHSSGIDIWNGRYHRILKDMIYRQGNFKYRPTLLYSALELIHLFNIVM